ncbi:MAG TPA: Hsp20/alpha crystallin family protein [Erysipelothrix sp.]|jgi:HSP20 family protein|nr:Hsp20/alpha crystallin family protein [Erysipelothrix sp.]
MRRTESLFDSFFRDLETNNYQLGKGIDIYKEDNQYVVLIDMPGFNRDDIKVDFKEDVLMITAEKAEEETNGKEYYFKNRSRKSVNRKIRFNDVSQDQIEGSYDNGVLKLVLPIEIPVEAQPRQIEIK